MVQDAVFICPICRCGEVIKHHHIRWCSLAKMPEGEVPLESHILHLADRVDISVNPEVFVLKQKSIVVDKIRANVGTVFHPQVFEAFAAAVPDIFWIEINNLELDQLFRRVDSSLNFTLSLDNILEFALTISRIIGLEATLPLRIRLRLPTWLMKLARYLDFRQSGV